MNKKKQTTNVFMIVYMKIKHKHPDWKHGQIRACTAYALRYQNKEIANGKV